MAFIFFSLCRMVWLQCCPVFCFGCGYMHWWISWSALAPVPTSSKWNIPTYIVRVYVWYKCWPLLYKQYIGCMVHYNGGQQTSCGIMAALAYDCFFMWYCSRLVLHLLRCLWLLNSHCSLQQKQQL